MTHGRKVCNTLKEIRQQIADKNEIEYTTSECHFEGECRGTCPKCESEVKYLEKELHKRSQLGKAVAVAGIALGMAGTFSAYSQNTLQNDSISKSEETSLLKGEANATIKGRVLETDGKTPLESATVRLMQEGRVVWGVITDAKGIYSFNSIPAGKYDLIVSFSGKSDTLQNIAISDSATKILDDIIIGKIIERPERVIIMTGRSTIDLDFDIWNTKWRQEKGELIRVW
jgi:hypothetical protein